MYILKIKGGAKIPEYIQIRDEEFTLIAYFRADHKSSWLDQNVLTERKTEIERLIKELPYGKIFEFPSF
jgi:hypothetical protein